MAAGCTPVVPAGAPAPAAPAEREAAYLYVGNSQGSLSTLTVYPLHGSKPSRVVRRTWGVNGMAVDPFGYVYTGNGLPTYGDITVYNPGGGSILLNIYSGDVRVFAFDAKGDVYVSDNGFISEYASHSDRVIRSIGPHTYNVDALAVDGSGGMESIRESRSRLTHPETCTSQTALAAMQEKVPARSPSTHREPACRFAF
jgi:hypothetical protein